MAIPADSPLTFTALATAAVSIGLASLVWQRRVARLEKLRRQLREIRRLSREVLRTPDAAAAAALIEESLRRALGDNTLRVRIGPAEEARPRASLPPFRLQFPLDSQENRKEFLEIRHSQEAGFSGEIAEALEDLAHHAAIAAEMRSQRAFREHAARTEQLAATGLLLSTIARDLRHPLESILQAARRQRLDALHEEAESALDLVDRLAAYARRETARTVVFDLNEAVRRLCEFRERSWRLLQMEVCARFCEEPLPVRAPRGLVEEAVLGLMVVAEQSQQGLEAARLDLQVSAREGRAVVSLVHPAPAEILPVVSDGLSACRNLVESCGGVLEEERPGQEVRLRAEFPLVAERPAEAAAARAPRTRRQLTLLLAHPRPEALRPLVRALAERGHRVAPAADAVQALEMAARLRFDAVFAPAGDPDWKNFASRVRQHVPVVGCLASGAHPAPDGIPVLGLNPGEQEIDECLAWIEGTVGTE